MAVWGAFAALVVVLFYTESAIPSDGYPPPYQVTKSRTAPRTAPVRQKRVYRPIAPVSLNVYAKERALEPVNTATVSAVVENNSYAPVEAYPLPVPVDAGYTGGSGERIPSPPIPWLSDEVIPPLVNEDFEIPTPENAGYTTTPPVVPAPAPEVKKPSPQSSAPVKKSSSRKSGSRFSWSGGRSRSRSSSSGNCST